MTKYPKQSTLHPSRIIKLVSIVIAAEIGVLDEGRKDFATSLQERVTGNATWTRRIIRNPGYVKS